jgi:hypothetical protein
MHVAEYSEFIAIGNNVVVQDFLGRLIHKPLATRYNSLGVGVRSPDEEVWTFGILQLHEQCSLLHQDRE